MEFCPFCVVVLILDRSSRLEHELCSSGKRNTTSIILDVLEAMFTFHFPWLNSNFQSTATPNALQHHLPARLLTFTVLVNVSLLIVPASVSLHSIANGIGFHNFRTHKSEGKFEQFLGRVWWGLWLSLLRLVFLAFVSVTRGSHWYLKAPVLIIFLLRVYV
jgi:hypothetical protein